MFHYETRTYDRDLEYNTVSQIVTSGKFPFTMGQMRTLLLNRKRNGLDVAVRKVGRKILIRMDLFLEWIEDHDESKF